MIRWKAQHHTGTNVWTVEVEEVGCYKQTYTICRDDNKVLELLTDAMVAYEHWKYSLSDLGEFVWSSLSYEGGYEDEC